MSTKRLSLSLLWLLCPLLMWAQQPVGDETLRMAPRANVISYDDENDIEHLRYLQSSDYLSILDELTVTRSDSGTCYSITVDVAREWRDNRIFFRFKATPGYDLYLDGRLVGVCHDACAVTEFDITPLLRFGREVVLELRPGSDEGSLLERDGVASGLTGDCALLFKPLLNVQDYTLLTDYDPATQSGSLTLEAELFNAARKGKCYLEVELWDPQGRQAAKSGKWGFFDRRPVTPLTLTTELEKVQPWCAATPRLYTLVVRLYDSRMVLQDVVGTRFGFRSLGTRSRLAVNGRDITLRGITLDTPLRLDSLADLQRLRSQLLQMKACNINAIRTCGGGPADARLYELCDELGFYVVCDANLFPRSVMGQVVAADPDYADLFSERVRNLYGQYKNHPSIIAWSLGEGRDNGTCMYSAYQALRQLDPVRPVLCAGAQYAENTDLIAPLEGNIDLLRQYLAKSQERHLVMLSYGSSVGNNLGGLAPLWQSVHDHDRVQGGFLRCGDWERLASLPYLDELRQAYAPVTVRLLSTSIDAAEFEVTNHSDFNTLSDYRLDYVLCTNLKPDVVSGDVTLSLAPGESKVFKILVPKLTLYTGEELSARFTLRQRVATPAVPKNTILGTFQFALPSSNVPRTTYTADGLPPLRIEKDSTHWIKIYNNDYTYIFDDSLGVITSVRMQGQELLRRPLSLCFGREPSPSDSLDPNALRQWQRYDMGIRNMDCEVAATYCRQLDGGAAGIDVLLRYSTPAAGPLFDVRQTYRLLPSGDLLLLNDITVSEQLKTLARVGMTLGVDASLATAEWLGRSVESYVDRNLAGQISQQQCPVSDLTYRYAQSQHSGNHTDVRWLSFHNDTVGLYLDLIDTLCQFSLMGDTLHIDYRHTGVGGALGSMTLDETALVKDHRYQFTLHLRPYRCSDWNAQDFRRIVYPRVTSSIIEMPVIERSRDRFDAAMQVSIRCATPGVEIRYTLDGSVPDLRSPRYTKPFAIQHSTIVRARAFRKGEPPSFVATRQFTFDYVVSCTFAHKPNTPYNKNAAKTLIDGELGDVNDLSRGWLGFSGHDVQVDLELAKTINMSSLTVRFAHVPDAWVFAPAAVSVQVSADGVTYSAPIDAPVTYDAASEAMNTTQLQQFTIPVDNPAVRFVRLVARPIARIPAWHRAKGLNPWMMLDEIKIDEVIVK